MTATPAEAGIQGARNRYVALALLIAVYTFNFLDRQIVSILATPIKAELHISDGDYGLLSGLGFAIVYSLLAVPIALLADRYSRSWIITISLAAWSGFTALCGTAGGFASLFLFRTGVGVGEAGGVAPSYSLISDLFPARQRARALAAYAFAIPLGTAAGLFVGAVIAAKWGWRPAFWTVGAAGLLLAPVFKLLVRDPATGAAAVQRRTQAASLWTVAGLLLRKPSFWLIAFGAAMASTVGYGVAFWLPTFFQRSFSFTLLQSGMYTAGLTLIGGGAGIWLGGVLADRLGQNRRGAYPLVPAVAFAIAIPAFYLASNIGDRTLAFLLFLIPTGLNLVWLGPLTTSVQHLVPANMRATASALFLLINNLFGIAVGLFYYGRVSDLLRPQFGAESMRYSIYSGLGFYVVSAVLLLIASRTLKRDWVEEAPPPTIH